MTAPTTTDPATLDRPEQAWPSISVVIPVFRDAGRAIAAVQAIASVRYRGDLEIIVIDDGSGDDTAQRIDATCGGKVRVHRLDKNLGRTAARNVGAGLATGEAIIFMDCDCLPESTSLLDEHAQALQAGHVASIGPVVGTGSGFWHDYQTRSSERRAALFRSGGVFSGSTQNMAIRRSAFVAIGGFDPAFAGYGFEDRDILMRLSALGTIAWTGSGVRHMDALRLTEVCAKMTEAGGNNSRLFSGKYPDAYRRLGYARIDARLHPILRPVGRFAGAIAGLTAGWTDTWLENERVPFALRAAAVRWQSAASFLRGTCLALPRQRE